MTEEQEKFMEENVFPIISLAGESKSLAYEALRLAKEKKFDEASQKMKEADEIIYQKRIKSIFWICLKMMINMV